MLPEELRQLANSVDSATAQLAAAGGAALAAGIVAAASARLDLSVDLATYTVSLACLRWIRLAPVPADDDDAGAAEGGAIRQFWIDVKGGLAEIRRHPWAAAIMGQGTLPASGGASYRLDWAGGHARDHLWRAARARCQGPARHSRACAGRGCDAVIKADAVSKVLRGEPLVSGFSATINAGDHLGIVGPNGVGKTTLLRVLAGTEAPTIGHIQHSADDVIRIFAQDHSLPDQLDEHIASGLGDTWTLHQRLGVLAGRRTDHAAERRPAGPDRARPDPRRGSHVPADGRAHQPSRSGGHHLAGQLTKAPGQRPSCGCPSRQATTPFTMTRLIPVAVTRGAP